MLQYESMLISLYNSISPFNPIMGCPASRQTVNHDKDHQFVILIKRLSLQFQLQSSRLMPVIAQIKSALRSEFNKHLENRSRAIEYSLLSDITSKTHLKAIYEHLSLQCKIILDRQRFVPILFSKSICSKQQADLKISVRKPIEVILFSLRLIMDGRDSVKNGDLLKFERTVMTKFKDVKQPQIVDHQLINFYRKNQMPSAEMVRETAFELCQEENISVSKFQQVGNNFKY